MEVMKIIILKKESPLQLFNLQVKYFNFETFYTLYEDEELEIGWSMQYKFLYTVSGLNAMKLHQFYDFEI